MKEGDREGGKEGKREGDVGTEVGRWRWEVWEESYLVHMICTDTYRYRFNRP